MIPANRRPDHCRDFSRNRDSVMISDEITDSLVSLLKVNYKNIICFSMQSLYRFTENWKRRLKEVTTYSLQYSRQTGLLKEWRSPKRAGNLCARTFPEQRSLFSLSKRFAWHGIRWRTSLLWNKTGRWDIYSKQEGQTSDERRTTAKYWRAEK